MVETTKKPQTFKKGNKVGKLYSQEYQPTPEAKSNGWKKAMTLKAIAKMLGEGRPAEQIVQQYKKLFPDIDKKQITHDIVVVAGQYHKAEINRDTKAAKYIAELKGETKSSVEVIAPIQITFSDKCKGL